MIQNNNASVLVIGAGIGGIRSALDLAETGHQVILIDNAPHIGGLLARLDRQFPSNHCGMCRLLPMVATGEGTQHCLRRGLFHPRIELLTATELMSVSGGPGEFTIALRRIPNMVDPSRCVGCGLCADVCPVTVEDEFGYGLKGRSAIHAPAPHAAAGPYVIDGSACTRCGACAAVCPTGAVTLTDARRNAFGILVVDDELIMRDSLKEWLVTEGFPATEMAASGAEALEALKSGRFRLMITDIKMPGMDGVELLQAAKREHPELCVLMMTAYATVETAVSAMKLGAREYFMKPFDPQVIIPLVQRIYEEGVAARDRRETVKAIITAAGVRFADPAAGINPYGSGRSPYVVTALQFEGILSHAGPTRGGLRRPADGKALQKIAWMQCVGSRDLSVGADFCSGICCLYAVRQAMLVRDKSGGEADTTIYYMDLRTVGKEAQRYGDKALAAGVRFRRARVHSVSFDLKTSDPIIRSVGLDGSLWEEQVDMVILSMGQRPVPEEDPAARSLDLARNPWGFWRHPPFQAAASLRPGIFLSGSAGGLKNIRASILQASSAALAAGCIIYEQGSGDSVVPPEPTRPSESLLSDPPRILAVVCTCNERLAQALSMDRLTASVARDPSVAEVVFLPELCSDEGWAGITEKFKESPFNRLLIGACHPDLFTGKLKALTKALGLPDQLAAIVHLYPETLAAGGTAAPRPFGEDLALERSAAVLRMGVARLKRAEPRSAPGTPLASGALVVGGGAAGMAAALGLARMGIAVDLVEVGDRLGGQLAWLRTTLEGDSPADLLDHNLAEVESHPLVTVHLNARITAVSGRIGRFRTTIEAGKGARGNEASREPETEIRKIRHRVVVLATGGTEAETRQYGCGTHPWAITQKEFERRAASGELAAAAPDTVVMILCVESRQAPRNFCSRVCCPTAVKHALYLKKIHPQGTVFVIYRDMMTTGFMEAYYTEARRAGVVFIPYTLDRKPHVSYENGRPTVRAVDPVLSRPIEIDADLLVLAAGIRPCAPEHLAEMFGVNRDRDDFFEEADAKWRPVDTANPGVFACGLALSPCTLTEAVTGGQAAAQRALRLFTREDLPVGKVTATVRKALCSLCRACIDACPFQARWFDAEADEIQVDAGICQGCGACSAACPNGAARLDGYPQIQVLEMIDASLD